MHPKDFFENAPAVKGGHCFVVMPFASELNPVYSAIKAALEAEQLDVVPHRADEALGGGHVMLDVLRNLAEAEVVIADLTGNNPNVLYELGIAHTVRAAESVLLIAQNVAPVPFDVQPNRRIEYTLEADGLNQLQAKLVEYIKRKILPTRFLFTLAPGQICESEKVPGEDRSLYSFTICDVMLGWNSAQFRLDVFRHHFNRPPECVYSEPQPALEPKGMVPIPMTSYALKLDEANPTQAVCCVCRPAAPSSA